MVQVKSTLNASNRGRRLFRQMQADREDLCFLALVPSILLIIGDLITDVVLEVLSRIWPFSELIPVGHFRSSDWPFRTFGILDEFYASLWFDWALVTCLIGHCLVVLWIKTRKRSADLRASQKIVLPCHLAIIASLTFLLILS